jgi:sigma-B regulation protein RsbU (phosphoserine phosphatase)
VLDPERHRLEFCNAGHNPPLLVGAGEPQRLRNKGVVLGIVEKFKYQGSAVDIAPGDVLVIFSDGVTEAVDIRDEEFGEQRLLTIVSDSRNESAATIQGRILDAVRKHAGSRAQNDDITLIVLKRIR